MDQLAHYVELAADWFALPLVIVVMATAIFFTIRLRFVQVPSVRRSRSRDDCESAIGGERGAIAAAGVHDCTGSDDRHRQHCGRSDGDCFGRAGCAVSGFGATDFWPCRRSSPKHHWACTSA